MTALTSAEDATGHSPELTELPDERACQTLQGHTKKRQVTLMPKSLRMPCQLGGPRFLMPPRVALAAWCL